MFRRRRSTFRRSRPSGNPRVALIGAVLAVLALIAAGVYFVGVADRVEPTRTEQRIELPNAIDP